MGKSKTRKVAAIIVVGILVGILITGVALSLNIFSLPSTGFPVQFSWAGGTIHVADTWEDWQIYYSDGHYDTLDTTHSGISIGFPGFQNGPALVYPTFIRVAVPINFLSKLPNSTGNYFGQIITSAFYVYLNGQFLTPSGFPQPSTAYTSFNKTGSVNSAVFYIILNNPQMAHTDNTLPAVNLTQNVINAGGSFFTVKVSVAQLWDTAEYCGGTRCATVADTPVNLSLTKSLPTFAGVVSTTVATTNALTSTATVVSTQTFSPTSIVQTVTQVQTGITTVTSTLTLSANWRTVLTELSTLNGAQILLIWLIVLGAIALIAAIGLYFLFKKH